MSESLKMIGKYSFNPEDLLGQGSFGKVFRGKNTENNKSVAIKMIDKKIIMKDEYLHQGLMQEVSVMKKLRSNYIVQLEDVFETGNNYYIIQECCDGGDFRNYLQKKQMLSEAEALGILKDVLTGFIELLKHGVIHRDLKPDNILMHQGVYKIADFGFAKQVQNFSKGLLTSSVGTPLYMSPQILKHEEYTTKSDIWSICVIYYEMLFGKIPWPARSQYELVNNIENQQVQFNGKEVSENSKDFILKGLKIKESERISWIEIYQHPLFQGCFNDKVLNSAQLENRAIFIINSIRQNISRCNMDIATIFNKFGLTTQSQMDMKQFSQMILQMDSSLTREEIEYLFNKFDENGDSTVDFKEFARWLESNNIGQKSQQILQRQLTMTETQSKRADQIISNLVYSIQKYNIDITKLFSKFDTSGDQGLNKQELAQIIWRIEKNLTDEEIQIIFQKFDDNNDGTINFIEFYHTLEKYRQLNQNINNKPNMQQQQLLSPEQVKYNQWLEQQKFQQGQNHSSQNMNYGNQQQWGSNQQAQNQQYQPMNQGNQQQWGSNQQAQNQQYQPMNQGNQQQQSQCQFSHGQNQNSQSENYGQMQQGSQYYNNQNFNQPSFNNQQQQMQDFQTQQYNMQQGYQQPQSQGWYGNQQNQNYNQNKNMQQSNPNINLNQQNHAVIPMTLSQRKQG